MTTQHSLIFNWSSKIIGLIVASASEPSSYQWTFGGTIQMTQGGISTYYGVDTSSPIDVYGGQANSASTSYTAPSVTTTVANTMLVAGFGAKAGGKDNTVTPPSGMTERYDEGQDNNGPACVESADVIQASAGASGTKVATGNSGTNIGHLVALKPNPNYQLDLEIRWTTADYNETNEYFCINVGTTGDEDLQVDVWTGSWTNLITDLNASSWNNVSISSYLTSDSLIVRFLGGTESGDANQDSWQIECSLLHVWSWEYNYNLDLEVQWTDANYTRTNEVLCIKTGVTDTEDVEVYVWNVTGSSWHKVFDDLAVNTWNNISVSTYLTDSNFTVRFRGGNETGDATQSSWEIDASLLHMWNDMEDYVYEYDYVLRVNNTETDSWEIRLKQYSDSSIGRLQNCTIYFRNSTNANLTQIVIENGSFNQTEGPWYNLDSLETIYIAMTVEANSTGTSYVYTYLEIRISGTTSYMQYKITFEIT